MGAPVRCRADPGILGQDRPPPAQPRRRPPGQPRAVGDRVHPPGLPPGHPRLRRTAHERGKVQGRDHPLPQALRRPRGLPPPPPARGLTNRPRGRPGPIFGCRIRAGLRTIRRPSPAPSSPAGRDLIRACPPPRAAPPSLVRSPAITPPPSTPT